MLFGKYDDPTGDPDGYLCKEEFCAVLENEIGLEGLNHGSGVAYFQGIDKNKDGKICEEELCEHLKSITTDGCEKYS